MVSKATRRQPRFFYLELLFSFTTKALLWKNLSQKILYGKRKSIGFVSYKGQNTSEKYSLWKAWKQPFPPKFYDSWQSRKTYAFCIA